MQPTKPTKKSLAESGPPVLEMLDELQQKTLEMEAWGGGCFVDNKVKKTPKEYKKLVQSKLPKLIRQNIENAKSSGDWLVSQDHRHVQHDQHGGDCYLAVRSPLVPYSFNRGEAFREHFCSLYHEEHRFWLTLAYPVLSDPRSGEHRFESMGDRYEWIRRHLREGRELISRSMREGDYLGAGALKSGDRDAYYMFMRDLRGTGGTPSSVLEKIFYETRDEILTKGCNSGNWDLISVSEGGEISEIAITLGQYRPCKLKELDVAVALAFDAVLKENHRKFFIPTPAFYERCIAPNIKGVGKGSPVEWAREALSVAHGFGYSFLGRDYMLEVVERPFLTIAQTLGNLQPHSLSTQQSYRLTTEFANLITKFTDQYPALSKPELLWLMVNQGYDWSRIVLDSNRGREVLLNFAQQLPLLLDRGFRIERLNELLDSTQGLGAINALQNGSQLVENIYSSSHPAPWWFKESFNLYCSDIPIETQHKISKVANYAFTIALDLYRSYQEPLTKLGLDFDAQLSLITTIARTVGWADSKFSSRSMDFILTALQEPSDLSLTERLNEALLSLDLLEVKSASELILRRDKLSLLGVRLSGALTTYSNSSEETAKNPYLDKSDVEVVTGCIQELSQDLETRRQLNPRLLPEFGSRRLVPATSFTMSVALQLENGSVECSSERSPKAQNGCHAPISTFNRLHRLFCGIIPDTSQRIPAMLGYFRHFAPHLSDPFSPPPGLLEAVRDLGILSVHGEDFDRHESLTPTYLNSSWRSNRELERRTVVAGLVDLYSDGILQWPEVLQIFDWLKGQPSDSVRRMIEMDKSFDLNRTCLPSFEYLLDEDAKLQKELRRDLKRLYGWFDEPISQVYAHGLSDDGSPIQPTSHALRDLSRNWDKQRRFDQGQHEEDRYSLLSRRYFYDDEELDESEGERKRREKRAAKQRDDDYDNLRHAVSSSVCEWIRSASGRRLETLSNTYALKLLLESPAISALLPEGSIKGIIRTQFLALISNVDESVHSYDPYMNDEEGEKSLILNKLSELLKGLNIKTPREATLLSHFVDPIVVMEELEKARTPEDLQPILGTLHRIGTPLAALKLNLLGLGDKLDPVQDSIDLMNSIVVAGDLSESRSLIRRSIPLREVVSAATDNPLANLSAIMKIAPGLIEHLVPKPVAGTSYDLKESNRAIVSSVVTSRLLFSLRQERERLSSEIQATQDLREQDLYDSIHKVLWPSRISLDEVVSRLKGARETFLEHLREARIDSFGLLPVGGKVHVTNPIDANILDRFKEAVGLSSTAFTLQHAERSILLPVCSSPFEMKEILAFLSQEGIINDTVPELQVGISRRLPVDDCAYLGAIVLLASPRIFQYSAESFATLNGNWDSHVGKKIITYDDDPKRSWSGNSNKRIPFTDLGGGRTDMLGRRDLWDVQAFQRVGTVLNHGAFGGEFAALAGELKTKIRTALRDACIEHVLSKMWVWDRIGSLSPDMGRQHFTDVIEPCLTARNKSDLHYEQTGENIGVYKELNDVITWLTQEMRPIQDLMLVSPKYAEERRVLFFME